MEAAELTDKLDVLRKQAMVTLMARNADYVIYITTKHDRTWSHLKEGDRWTRIGPNGRVHRMSAEQLLSHLLPPLAAEQPGLSVRVERRPVEEKS